MSLFKLRGKLTKTQNLVLGIVGLFILVAVWWILAEVNAEQRAVIEDYETHLPSSILQDSTVQPIDRDSLARADSIKLANATEFEKVYPILPPPNHVVAAFPDLFQEDRLIYNSKLSIWRNLQGYFWAILISVVIGFMIGLIPLFRGLFSKQVDALRYLPLTALTGLFIIWFGIEDKMKIAFLAFGILVYMLPVVVQRIDEVKDVYLKTVFTLGATDWQTIRSVYFPSVFSKLMDDIRVLTAISWTYIIIAELLNRQGGLGALIYVKARQGQLEKVFAILIVIILIGFLQDRIFVYMDQRLFPHKYAKKRINGIKEVEYGLMAILLAITLAIIVPAIIPSTLGMMGNLATILAITGVVVSLYGEYRLRKASVEAA
ncbi:MAG: ABC transporter permease subunit [Saprospiraceae bacterium]|nr:ABC transporter permease subunit [Saprospiraceae bacterium]